MKTHHIATMYRKVLEESTGFLSGAWPRGSKTEYNGILGGQSGMILLEANTCLTNYGIHEFSYMLPDQGHIVKVWYFV